MSPTDLEARPKHKAEREEGTRPGAYFTPLVDIYETPEELVLVADMPGVSREDVEVHLDGDTLTVEGRANADEYEGLKPVYVEYGVGDSTAASRWARRSTGPASRRS